MEKSNEVSNFRGGNPETAPTQTSVSPQPVEDTLKPQSSVPENPKWLVPVLIIAVILSVGAAGYFAYQNYQIKQQTALIQTTPTPTSTPLANEPIPTSTVPATSPPAKMMNWESYSNTSAGFGINYPTGWRKVETQNWTGFGPKEIGEDVVWGISYYNKSAKTITQIEDEVGKQFPDRKQTKEAISFEGITATKVVTTTNQYADWYSVTIIIDSGNIFYAIGNSAQTDKAFNEMVARRTGKSSNLSFEDFYTSFKKLN